MSLVKLGALEPIPYLRA